MAGHRVKYVLAAKLVNELVEAADERQLSKAIARYGRVDLLASTYAEAATMPRCGLCSRGACRRRSGGSA